VLKEFEYMHDEYPNLTACAGAPAIGEEYRRRYWEWQKETYSMFLEAVGGALFSRKAIPIWCLLFLQFVTACGNNDVVCLDFPKPPVLSDDCIGVDSPVCLYADAVVNDINDMISYPLANAVDYCSLGYEPCVVNSDCLTGSCKPGRIPNTFQAPGYCVP